MTDPLRAAAAGEAATGLVLVLMLFPALVVSFLFGVETAGVGLAVGRLLGMALVALGIACLPGTAVAARGDRRRTAMLVYGALAAIYLGGLGLQGTLRGPLLWPAVAIHAGVSAWLALDSTRTIR